MNTPWPSYRDPELVKAVVHKHLHDHPDMAEADFYDPLFHAGVEQLMRVLAGVSRAMREEGVGPDVAHRVLCSSVANTIGTVPAALLEAAQQLDNIRARSASGPGPC